MLKLKQYKGNGCFNNINVYEFLMMSLLLTVFIFYTVVNYHANIKFKELLTLKCEDYGINYYKNNRQFRDYGKELIGKIEWSKCNLYDDTSQVVVSKDISYFKDEIIKEMEEE